MGGWSVKDYDEWRAKFLDPAWAAAYGDDYIAFEWWSYVNNLDKDTYTDTLLAKGWTGVDMPGFSTSGGGGRGGRGGGGGGGAGAGMSVEYLADQVKAMAAEQLIKISDDSAQMYANAINQGGLTADSLQATFTASARARYPWALPALDAGVTMRDFTLPVRDQIAEELEMQPNAVDLLDPKWQSYLSVVDEKGNTRATTSTEVVKLARNAPEFKQTGRAADIAASGFLMLRDVLEGGVR
jgi:hypothetical protein